MKIARRWTYLMLLLTCCAVPALLASSHGAHAATFTGNGGYSLDRLPWQHGQSHVVTQGYNEGDHSISHFQPYAVDFDMPSETPVLAITDGYACFDTTDSSAGLGFYVVEAAPAPQGAGRTGTDFYFYGHNGSSWLPHCGNGWTFVYEGQIASWSDNTGVSSGPHLHLAAENPGTTCYCSSGGAQPVPIPLLSGLDMSTFHGYDQPQSILVSDNVMPGDDNTVPQPGHNDPIFNAWWNLGGAEGIPPTEPPVGVPFDTNHSGPGVHIWGGGLVQDVTAPGDDGILMLFYGQSVAYWVHGSIRNFYFAQGGATGSLGYPVSNEYPWQGYTRSDFQGESICASITQGTNYCDVIGILDVSPTPTPTHTQVPTPTNTGVPTATSTPLPQQSQTLRPTGAGTYTEWGEMFGSGTTHWDRVDDVAPDDTGSYIMDNTWSGTERDSYQLSDTSLSSISSVEVVARAARITTNDNNDVKLFIHSGSVDAESVAKPLSMSWGEVSNVWTTDPATSGPWTQSAVNALQAGVRDAMGGGGGGGVGVTQVYVIVTQGSQTLRPTANGNYTEWGEQFGSGTTHWDRVDEATVDDAGSYIMDNTWNGTERDAYQMSDTSYSSITSIEVFARAARVGTNDNNNVKLSIRSGSVDQDSTAKTLSMSWGYVSNVWTTDPATGLPWTTAAVNALQAGVRNAMGPSGGGGVGVSQVYVVVHGS